MALFLSTVVNKIDRKGRVSVPVAFRNAIAGQSFQGIIAFPSFKNAALQCGGIDWMQRLSESVGDFDLFSDEHDEMTATLFANAQQLAFDGDGRVILPADLIAHAKISDKAAFVGRGS
ncbi:MAG: division/cell wall cluster transcriptional repressor MraZ, partial [Alphaproteobacteria bacterium]